MGPYCYLKIINTIHRLKQASCLGTVSRGKGLGRRLITRGWFFRFCKPIEVDAIAFNKAKKAWTNRFPVRQAGIRFFEQKREQALRLGGLIPA